MYVSVYQNVDLTIFSQYLSEKLYPKIPKFSHSNDEVNKPSSTKLICTTANQSSV